MFRLKWAKGIKLRKEQTTDAIFEISNPETPLFNTFLEFSIRVHFVHFMSKFWILGLQFRSNRKCDWVFEISDPGSLYLDISSTRSHLKTPSGRNISAPLRRTENVSLKRKLDINKSRSCFATPQFDFAVNNKDGGAFHLTTCTAKILILKNNCKIKISIFTKLLRLIAWCSSGKQHRTFQTATNTTVLSIFLSNTRSVLS